MKTKSNISRKNILRCIKNADRKKERNAARQRYDKQQYDKTNRRRCDTMMCAKKTSDGRAKMLECEDGGELKVLLCGKTISGEILPILVDEDGCILTTPST